MTMPPDPNRPPDEPPEEPPEDQAGPTDGQDRPLDDQDRPLEDQPTDAVTSVTSVTSLTAEPDPAPAEPEVPGENGHEVEVETTRAASAHTVAYPGPIPDYAMEPTVERPAAVPASDPVDTAPTRRFPDDGGLTIPLTVPLTRERTHPLPPDPPDLPPDPPQLTPVATNLTPGPTYPTPDPPYPVAPGPAYPEASVRPRRHPLFGTIVWGVILLALAGYVLLGVLVPAPADPTLWLLGGVIVIGLLLIVVGIIAALRRAG